MFSLFKRNNDNQQVPEWASFFNRNEYNEFLKAIDSYFISKHISYEHDDGVLHLGANDFGFTNLGLSNVAQVCKQDKPKYYGEIVERHFETMIRARLFDKEFEKIVDDYDKIKQYIGVRLYHKEYATYIGIENTIGRDFAGDIYAMLIFDLPDTIVNVKPDQAQKWSKNINELFETGVQNIKEKYPLEISEQDMGKLKIWFVQGDHFFTPNIALDIQNMPKFIGKYGSLIGIPHRHSVLIYPIENMEVLNAVNGLIPVVHGMHIEGPGSVSNNLLWYKDGHWENLPYKVENSKLEFFPPINFVEMLNTLSTPN